ncbi:MAG: hypothetical protein MRY75_00485 [Marivita sp.]|uniref:hypothetical protein n=1 Tax=Marivita sp. TaxID=2003365 RepID=UPI0025C6B971|nr:hypothetical protein [Marivita sp.]MCI5109002.1 hypothetical protein [Marivita sp.]
MAGGPDIPCRTSIGWISWAAAAAIGLVPAGIERRAAIPAALHTKSQTEPILPTSKLPQASQSSIAIMPPSVETIDEAMAIEPADCATAPMAKTTSERMQIRRAQRLMILIYYPRDPNASGTKSRFLEHPKIGSFKFSDNRLVAAATTCL